MAWLERRGERFRVVFRFRNQKFHANLKASDPKEAGACLARLEENLRLVERGRLTIPVGADLGLFLLSDGKLEQPVELVRSQRLDEMFATYKAHFTAGAKEAITRKMEDVHMNHLARILGGQIRVAAITAGTVQQFVDVRGREEHNGHPVKPKTVRKAVSTLRFVWNWSNRQGHVPTRFPVVELVFPKEKQPEPFRTYDQIKAILARGVTDPRRLRELWDGLFLNPTQVAEVIAHVQRKTNTKWLYPFLVTAAYTGARRGELFRARIEDFDFDAKHVLLREKKRSRDRETFRTVDMTGCEEAGLVRQGCPETRRVRRGPADQGRGSLYFVSRGTETDVFRHRG